MLNSNSFGLDVAALEHHHSVGQFVACACMPLPSDRLASSVERVVTLQRAQASIAEQMNREGYYATWFGRYFYAVGPGEVYKVLRRALTKTAAEFARVATQSVEGDWSGEGSSYSDRLYLACYLAAAASRAMSHFEDQFRLRSPDAMPALRRAFSSLDSELTAKVAAVPPLLPISPAPANESAMSTIDFVKSLCKGSGWLGLTDVHRFGVGVTVPLDEGSNIRLTPGLTDLGEPIRRLQAGFSGEALANLWQCRKRLQVSFLEYLDTIRGVVESMGGHSASWHGDGILCWLPISRELTEVAWRMQDLKGGFLSSIAYTRSATDNSNRILHELDVAQLVLKACAGGPLDWGVQFKYPSLLTLAQVNYIAWRLRRLPRLRTKIIESLEAYSHYWVPILPHGPSSLKSALLE